MNERKKVAWAYAGLTLMTLIIGFSFIFVKIALRHAPPSDLLAHRFTTATIGLIIYYVFNRRKRPGIKRENIPALLALSLFYPLLLFGFQTLGLKYTSASEAGIISAVTPIITLVLAALFLKEKNTPVQILFVLLSVSGVIYIMYRNGITAITGASMKGNMLILLSVISIAIYYVMGRKANKQFNSMDITFFMSLTACIVFNCAAVAMHVKSGNLAHYFDAFKNPGFLWPILYLGILSTFLTSFLGNNALSVIPAAQVSIFNNFSPVISVFGGVFFLNETLKGWHIIGGILVLGGIIGVNYFRK
ncbi:MAG TPA: DMT family transporter [Bacteroidales bacterium]|nr:EamA family transporter [Bacteroidales bacterium]HNR41076.1 DMT family transporter [Bacteroidales bacterium]HPM18199.1 DMT family transporter [Bacteroidales bacterium]HQG77154.1 DMT family transporter [Bacteroidales bacterium]